MFCPNCGKEIEDDANFCRYCGKNLNGNSIQKTEPVEEKSKKQVPEPQKSEEIVKELNDFRYCPKCMKKISKTKPVCVYCGYVLDKEDNSDITSFVGFVILIIGIIFCFIVWNGLNSGKTDSNTNKNVEIPNKEERMKLTNDFMVKAKNGGLVTAINKECTADDEFCSYYIRVNENMWSMFSFEDKENFNKFVQEYAQLRTKEAAATVEGHYTGKVLANKFKGVTRE